MIPVSEPYLGLAERTNVDECMRSGWIAGGPYIERFEQQWASYCNRRYGVAVCNGTTALELAISALDIQAGSEVILPSFTIISCAIAVVRNGLKPVFVDVNIDDWCVNVDQIAAKLTNKTKAIMPVHMYGHPANMAEIRKIASGRNIWIVEDAAQAHGAEHDYPGFSHWPKAGFAGDVSCFSFYANKIISTGEGGMVLTDRLVIAERLRAKRNLCFGIGDNRFMHSGLGHNFRMTNIQAAIGVAQIAVIDEVLFKKKVISDTYRDLLGHQAIAHQIRQPWARSSNWMHGIVLDRPAQPVMRKLFENGVETRPFFSGLHKQPGLETGDVFPVTDHLASHGFYLPSGATLQEDQLAYIATTLKGLL